MIIVLLEEKNQLGYSLGYEKPWDLKPHQRDDRPPNEYDSAWDGRNVESDVIAAKLAKEASRLADCMEQRRGYRPQNTGESGVERKDVVSSGRIGQQRQAKNSGDQSRTRQFGENPLAARQRMKMIKLEFI